MRVPKEKVLKIIDKLGRPATTAVRANAVVHSCFSERLRRFIGCCTAAKGSDAIRLIYTEVYSKDLQEGNRTCDVRLRSHFQDRGSEPALVWRLYSCVYTHISVYVEARAIDLNLCKWSTETSISISGFSFKFFSMFEWTAIKMLLSRPPGVMS